MSEKIRLHESPLELKNGINNRFGASFKFEETGFFWSNIESIDEFERVLTNVFQASAAEFEIISRPFADQLMVHDYGNTKIRAYVEGVLTDSLESK
jgi:surface carbohydrate biosynthesis protein